ncbi:ABC transporter ATP-binding protein [Bacillus niameyensis]|uniref:ABC transporter ATP-binding protein n=1 Tax=Bacillus niameyensis TaxID=1522308 RepID=UPI0007847189|nr:ABC transporter ATP-binding protein [Bacillus niameyensis]
MTKAILEARNLGKSFGGVRAVDRFEIELKKSELVGLIGPNGAGKSTVFNLLSGAIKPTDGTIHLFGKDITGKKMVDFAQAGIARTFQNIRLLEEQTVFENVLAATHKSANRNFFANLFHTKTWRREEMVLQERVELLLETFSLLDKRNELANNLSYGDQRRVEIVRALATDPEVLFLDEPAAGMNPAEGKELVQLIEQVQKDYNITVVLIEHDMDVVMDLCERILVLDYGKLIFSGTPQEVMASDAVRSAYLGDDLINA